MNDQGTSGGKQDAGCRKGKKRQENERELMGKWREIGEGRETRQRSASTDKLKVRLWPLFALYLFLLPLATSASSALKSPTSPDIAIIGRSKFTSCKLV